MHYSGSWYDSGAQTYIDAAQSAMLTQPWPALSNAPLAAQPDG